MILSYAVKFFKTESVSLTTLRSKILFKIKIIYVYLITLNLNKISKEYIFCVQNYLFYIEKKIKLK